jgi:hypothetical protein
VVGVPGACVTPGVIGTLVVGVALGACEGHALALGAFDGAAAGACEGEALGAAWSGAAFTAGW